jgi:CheY-like chemotaxis protein/nitrogen-specific signal transduction histidine kinase
MSAWRVRDSDRHLDVLSRAQRQFLAVVSHELRTPLSGILGSVELLRRSGGAAFAGGTHAVLLDLIEASATHMLDLTGDVLDLSSAEAGRMHVVLQPVSIAAICESSVQLIQSLAWSKQLTIHVDIEPSLTHVHAQPRRLRQILGNLLGNAVKFTPAAGNIGLRVTRSDDGMRCVFEVWDDGPGLTAEQVTRLQAFEPYTQLMQVPEGTLRGAGLGLSIVKRLVDLHSGTFSIHGVPGAGSRFRVEIPLASPDAAQVDQDVSGANVSPLAEPVVRPGTRVLMVDDVPGNVLILSTYLAHIGFDVMSADSGQRALDILRDTAVNVLVCDIRMPDMDGWSLTRLIRNSPRHAALPIVALTASSGPEDRQRCLAAGMNEYLIKPVPLSQLGMTIARLAQRDEQSSGAQAQLAPVEGLDEGLAGPGDSAETLLLHDINDALGAAIGNLDLALHTGAVCESAALRDALDSCLRIADLLKRLRRPAAGEGSG